MCGCLTFKTPSAKQEREEGVILHDIIKLSLSLSALAALAPSIPPPHLRARVHHERIPENQTLINPLPRRQLEM